MPLVPERALNLGPPKDYLSSSGGNSSLNGVVGFSAVYVASSGGGANAGGNVAFASSYRDSQGGSAATGDTPSEIADYADSQGGSSSGGTRAMFVSAYLDGQGGNASLDAAISASSDPRASGGSDSTYDAVSGQGGPYASSTGGTDQVVATATILNSAASSGGGNAAYIGTVLFPGSPTSSSGGNSSYTPGVVTNTCQRVVRDSFNRADSPSCMVGSTPGVADTGQAWVPLNTGGGAAISGGEVEFCVSSAGGTENSVYVPVPASDRRVSVDFTIGNLPGPGILLPGPLVYLQVSNVLTTPRASLLLQRALPTDPFTPTIRTLNLSNNADVSGSPVTIPPGSPHTVAFELAGNVLTGYVDGTPVVSRLLTSVDAQLVRSGGNAPPNVGFGAYRRSTDDGLSRADDFDVQSCPQPCPASGGGNSTYSPTAAFCIAPLVKLPPDAILEQSNLVGTVDEIQDDPDAPDGSWLAAANVLLATDVRTSFPTPARTLCEGTQQRFRALVRPTTILVPPPVGLVCPASIIELWENGILLDSSSSFSVCGEEVVEWSWDPALLSDPSGAGVECRLNNQASEVDNVGWTVEVGAVEWIDAPCGACTYVSSNGGDGSYSGTPTFAVTAISAAGGDGAYAPSLLFLTAYFDAQGGDARVGSAGPVLLASYASSIGGNAYFSRRPPLRRCPGGTGSPRTCGSGQGASRRGSAATGSPRRC